MTRSEQCARVAARSSPSTADVVAALGALTSTIVAALAECETVTVAGFGKFAAKTRAACQGRNPRPRRGRRRVGAANLVRPTPAIYLNQYFYTRIRS